jgi:2'-5' RNA ligase
VTRDPDGAGRDARPATRRGGPSDAGREGGSFRLFVALDLPPDARAALARFRDAAADPGVWRPLDDDALHVTLAFLGRRPEADVAVVEGVLAALPGAAPPLVLTGALLLPPRRARVLCAAIADPGRVLERLQRAASDGLAAAGVYEPERRPFRAHATVARLRSGARPPARVDAAPEPVAFAGEAVTLYRSHLARTGARYEPLVRRPLV